MGEMTKCANTVRTGNLQVRKSSSIDECETTELWQCDWDCCAAMLHLLVVCHCHYAHYTSLSTNNIRTT